MELHADKFNCVHDNPYKTNCTIIPKSWDNPTGRQFNILPFGISHDKTLSRYFVEDMFPTNKIIESHCMYPNNDGKFMVPQTVYPRPAVKIGYEYRNS